VASVSNRNDNRRVMFFLGDIRKTIYLGKGDAKTAKGVKEIVERIIKHEQLVERKRSKARTLAAARMLMMVDKTRLPPSIARSPRL
jgi:hypothetical protein